MPSLRPKKNCACRTRVANSPRKRNFWISSGVGVETATGVPVLFKGELPQQVCCQNAATATSLLSSATRSAGNHPQRLHKWHRGLPVLGRGDAYPSLRCHLSASVDTSMAALVPERVMVRAVGHWSNTTSLWAHQCSNWRNCSFRAALSDGKIS